MLIMPAQITKPEIRRLLPVSEEQAMTSQQGLSYLGVGGVVEGCGHSPSRFNLGQLPPCSRGGAFLQGSRRYVAADRNPPLWRVSCVRGPITRLPKSIITDRFLSTGIEGAIGVGRLQTLAFD